MSSPSRFIGCLAVLVGAAWVAPTAPPCDAPPDKVKVSVIVILASETNAKVDPKLTCIACELKKKYPKLAGFQLAGKCSCKSLTVGVKENFDLIADQTAAVTVEQAADEDNFVQLKVTPPSMGEITYRTVCGKFLPIVTPVQIKNDIVIIAVRVQPCNGK
jgi:hypothetical protein